MSRYRKPLEVIDVDNDDSSVVKNQTPKMLDFTSDRKKGKTTKKRGIFTPMKVPEDIKPKLEPYSPTVYQSEHTTKSKRASKAKAAVVQPKLEPDQGELVAEGSPESGSTDVPEDYSEKHTVEQDVKPDVLELESLLGGLNFVDQLSDPRKAPVQTLNRSPSPSSARNPSRNINTSRPSTPLFMSYDSPELSPFSESLNLSPSSVVSSIQNSPRFQARPEVSALASTSGNLFDLFSSDSPPPPPRHLRSPSATSSISDADCASYHSDSGNESPIAGPSKPRKTATLNQSRRRSSQSPSVQASPSSSVRGAAHSLDVKPDITSFASVEDVKPSIHSLPTATPSSKPRRRAFLEFLDTVAKSASEPEEEYEYELNEGVGSLEDFIVDDDEVSYISDSEDGLRGLESEDEDSDVVEVKIDTSADSDADSDIFIEEAVSHPKIGRVSGLDFLKDFDESDQDVLGERSDPDDLLDAIDSLTIAGKPGKGKAKGKMGVKAPKWAVERVRLAQEVFDDLDKRVFDGQLGPGGAGAKIIWNKRLLTTAGTAQRKRRRQAGGETSWDLAIQLSEKVCTGEEQVLSTVAHEMCHLACWVIDKQFKNPHGKVFKSWGRKVMRKRNDLEVTTKHDYVIEYKYHWRCIDCKKVYKRHSKSIDIEKQGCGICKGKLEALFKTKLRGMSTFQVYLKQNMKTAKAALPKASHGDVMRALSARWNEAGPEADHEGHWKAVLAASRG